MTREELLARVEAATEGDNDLDREVAIALGWTPPAMGLPFWYDYEGNHWTALPDWSTSIDDALALVERAFSSDFHFVELAIQKRTYCEIHDQRVFDPLGNAEAQTAPLAIIAALLRAKETDNG